MLNRHESKRSFNVREVFLTICPGCVRWIINDGPKTRSGSDPIDATNTPYNDLIAFGLKNAVGGHRGLTSVVLHIEDERWVCQL